MNDIKSRNCRLWRYAGELYNSVNAMSKSIMSQGFWNLLKEFYFNRKHGESLIQLNFMNYAQHNNIPSPPDLRFIVIFR